MHPQCRGQLWGPTAPLVNVWQQRQMSAECEQMDSKRVSFRIESCDSVYLKSAEPQNPTGNPPAKQQAEKPVKAHAPLPRGLNPNIWSNCSPGAGTQARNLRTLLQTPRLRVRTRTLTPTVGNTHRSNTHRLHVEGKRIPFSCDAHHRPVVTQMHHLSTISWCPLKPQMELCN